MKTLLNFPKLARTEMKTIAGGVGIRKTKDSCGPSCATTAGIIKCNWLECRCTGVVCGV